MKTIMMEGKKLKVQVVRYRYLYDILSAAPLNRMYIFQQWDTAGQERFRTITTSYYRNSQGILLVYDITDRNTFNNIRNWVAQINLHADVNINKILIGNKCDLIKQRVSARYCPYSSLLPF